MDLALRIVRLLVGVVATSVAATATTAPITAWHFAQVPPAGLVANALVVPLAELCVLPLGLAGAGLSLVSPTLGGPLVDLAGLGAGWMAAFVHAVAAHAPPGHLPAPTLLEALAWYALVVAAGHALVAGWWRGRGALLVAGAAFAACLGWRLISPVVAPRLELHFLDVGQADACLVELPGGTTLLVDGGGSFDPDWDPGSRLIVPWLRRHGVRRIDAVVLTHPHPDHAGGLAAVVDAFPVGEVWTSGVESALPALLRLEDAARRRGVPVLRPHDLRDPGGATVEVLHPFAGDVRRAPPWGAGARAVAVPAGYSENDGSIVLRVAWAGRAALLTGDVERRAEARLLDERRDDRPPPESFAAAALPPLEADILKAPHHGSRTSSTPAFAAAVRPALVVFSVGYRNQWGFPAPSVDERYRRLGARTLRTDTDGSVSVRIDGDGELSVHTARRP